MDTLPRLAIALVLLEIPIQGVAQEPPDRQTARGSVPEVDRLWRPMNEADADLLAHFGRAARSRPKVREIEGRRVYAQYVLEGFGPGEVEHVSFDRAGVESWLVADGRAVPLGLAQVHFGRWTFRDRFELLCEDPDIQGLIRVRHAPHPGRSLAFSPDGVAPIGEALQRVGGESVVDTAAPGGAPAWSRSLRDPGVLREIRVRVDADRDASTTLEIDVDELPRVRAPLAAFFGVGAVDRPFTTRYLGRTAGGWSWCRLPIPFAVSCSVRLVDSDAKRSFAREDCELAWSSEDVDPDRDLTLHASTRTFSGPRSSAETLRWFSSPSFGLDDGRLAGLVLSVRSSDGAPWSGSLHWDRILSHAGRSELGLDQLFGGGWNRVPEQNGTWLACKGAATGPLVGSFDGVLWLGPGPGHTAIRSQELEWTWRPWRSGEASLTSVAYSYSGINGFDAGLRERRRGPSEAQAASSGNPSGAPDLAPIWLEGEDLTATASVPGRIQTQDLRAYPGGRWSQDAHLFWTGPKPGDRLVLGVPVPEAGRYVLQLALTTARDYGRFRIRFAGQPMGETIELYTSEVRSTGLREVGRVAIDQAGTIPLEIEVVGKHPKAVEAYLFGLDAVRLVPLR